MQDNTLKHQGSSVLIKIEWPVQQLKKQNEDLCISPLKVSLHQVKGPNGYEHMYIVCTDSL